MKKTFIFMVYIFASFCLSAQKKTVKKTAPKTNSTIDFCNALKKVQADAYNNFEKITSGEKSMLYDNNKKEIAYASRSILTIPGAMVTYIDEIHGSPVKNFVAYFGTYTSEKLARKKLEIVKAQLSECLKDYEVFENFMPNFGTKFMPEVRVSLSYCEKRTDNTEKKQLISLKIELDHSNMVYKVFMQVQGIYINAATKKNEPASNQPNINTSLSIATGIDSSNLLSTDNKNENRFYKELPITLKKGMGAIFYMETNAFKPYLALYSPGDGKSFGKPHLKGNNRIVISFTAPADTTFSLIFTSGEENETGKFYYGYSILDASQMAFSNDFTLCQKLGYLITQRQANWELLPTSVEHHFDEELLSSYDYRTTPNTLIRGSSTEITYQYKEILFSSKEFFADVEFYNKICKDIAACLGENWESKSEEIEEKISDYSKETRKYSVTHFFVKGANGQPYKSFKILRNPDQGNGISSPFEVHLVFE